MIVTFYSFKGGVGRSMAMVNVGEILADMGYRVILSDWDLEAPGLERYLWPSDPRVTPYRKDADPLLAQPGLIELLEEYKRLLSSHEEDPKSEDESSGEFATVGTLRLRRPSSRLQPVSTQISRPGSLRMLTAGRRDGEYLQRYAEAVRRFDWQDFYDRWVGDAYIEFFRKDLAGDPLNDVRGAADILLIDSRTGVTEHGGVITHHLADVVIVLTAANDLNMQGTKWMVDALLDPELTKLRGGRPMRVIPVASRIEQNAQRDELLDFRRRFIAEFRRPLADSVGDPEAFALATEIKYMPFYSFYERVVAREPEGDREHELDAAYRALADGIIRCGVSSGVLREPTSQGIVARAPVSLQTPEARAPQWDHDRFVAELRAAVDLLDRARVAELTEDFEEHLRSTDEVYPSRSAAEILRHLRRKRYFDLVQRAAEKLIEYGQSTFRIRMLYAQSLIEQGNLAGARSTLQSTISETKTDSPEHAEARGLLATVFERQYLDLPDPSSSRSRQNLERAINTYYEVYQSHPNLFSWQGIKTVALVQRARRDGIELESAPDATSLAQAILAVFEKDLVTNDWMIAIAIEASLALEEHESALKWLQRYLPAPVNDAFQLTSLHRELTEIWQLDSASEPGASLLPPLRAAILQRGGQLDLEISDAPRAIPAASKQRLQAILGTEGYRAVTWYSVGMERFQGLARIESRTGAPLGNGFLLCGADLHPSLGDDLVLVTCASVVSDDPTSRYALRPYETVAVLDARSETVGLKQIIFSSTQLDLSIVRLDRRLTGITGYPISEEPPLADAARRMFLVSYPADGQLSISADVVLDYEEPLIHFRTSTAAVLAGSPIFDEQWRLLGIHHFSSTSLRRLRGQPGGYAANEGIWIGSIIRLLAAVLRPPRERTRAAKPQPRKKPAKQSRSASRKR